MRRGAGAPGRRDRAIACSGIGSERRAWHRTMVDAPTAVRALAASFGRGAIGMRATRVFPGARGRILRAMSDERRATNSASADAARVRQSECMPVSRRQHVRRCRRRDDRRRRSAKHFDAIWKVAAGYRGDAPHPTPTGVGVTWLDGFRFEIKMIAKLPQALAARQRAGMEPAGGRAAARAAATRAFARRGPPPPCAVRARMLGRAAASRPRRRS